MTVPLSDPVPSQNEQDAVRLETVERASLTVKVNLSDDERFEWKQAYSSDLRLSVKRFSVTVSTENGERTGKPSVFLVGDRITKNGLGRPHTDAYATWEALPCSQTIRNGVEAAITAWLTASSL